MGIAASTSYRQLTLLYRNLGNGAFADVTDSSGPALQQPRPSRGLAAGDLDGDGHPEVVVVNVNASPAVLKNRAKPGNAVVFRLRGRQSNRSGIGARVELTAGGRTAQQAVISGGSYLSQNDLALHFGLANSDLVDEPRVVWPSGLEQRWIGMAGNQRYVLTEGSERPEATALAGRGAPDSPAAGLP